jgi:hypothetical protein
MQLNDARAAGFNADTVRDAIQFAMQLGMPDKTNERVKFVFEPVTTFDRQDPAGNPYEWTAPPATTTGEYREVEVPVAMEFISRTSQGRDTTMGYLLPSHVEIYIMDIHIDEVKDANYVLIDDDRYQITAWPPPIGLFDFTLYPALLEAVDES